MAFGRNQYEEPADENGAEPLVTLILILAPAMDAGEAADTIVNVPVCTPLLMEKLPWLALKNVQMTVPAPNRKSFWETVAVVVPVFV